MDATVNTALRPAFKYCLGCYVFLRLSQQGTSIQKDTVSIATHSDYVAVYTDWKNVFLFKSVPPSTINIKNEELKKYHSSAAHHLMIIGKGNHVD